MANQSKMERGAWCLRPEAWKQLALSEPSVDINKMEYETWRQLLMSQVSVDINKTEYEMWRQLLTLKSEVALIKVKNPHDPVSEGEPVSETYLTDHVGWCRVSAMFNTSSLD